MNNNKIFIKNEISEDDYVRNEIISKIKSLYVDCPECESMESDDQYSCGTCGGQGTGGLVNVWDWIFESLLQEEKNNDCCDNPFYVMTSPLELETCYYCGATRPLEPKKRR